ncbi:MAG: FecR family protein [Desulfobacteraceae bacterium]|nr:FecR family protein [Desulfobacteraceae bacterium]
MHRYRHILVGMGGLPALLAVGWLLTITIAVSPAGAQATTATWVQGRVESGPAPDGPWTLLREGMAIQEKFFVQTGEDGRIEITLAGGSVIRLGKRTTLQIRQSYTGEEKSPSFVSELRKGRFWARVGKVFMEKDGRFFSNLPSATIGVRGTVYRIDAAVDKSADIYVYQGVVGVGPPIIAEGAAKEAFSWPAEVSEQQWEEIILRQLQRLRIDRSGRPGRPEAFDPAKEVDEWVLWNRERDALLP